MYDLTQGWQGWLRGRRRPFRARAPRYSQFYMMGLLLRYPNILKVVDN
jgi:hypothetical protein